MLEFVSQVQMLFKEVWQVAQKFGFDIQGVLQLVGWAIVILGGGIGIGRALGKLDQVVQKLGSIETKIDRSKEVLHELKGSRVLGRFRRRGRVK